MPEETKDIISELESRIAAECSAVDCEARFDEMLDECYSFKAVGGPFEWMTPSRVLREVDPTAHRCGVNDYADGQPWTEVGGETYQDEDIDGIKDELVDELDSKQSDLESEIEELEAAVEAEETGWEQAENELHEKQGELKKVEEDLKKLYAHSF